MIRLEENLLKAFKIDLGSKTLRDEQVVVRKRKNFEDLTSETSKNARLNNVVEMLESDIGLEQKVLEKLENRKEGKSEDEFDMACLGVMKTLGISNTKYDDLRFWVQDMLRRNIDLSLMPTSRQLMEKVQAEMVPPNMTCSSTGASFPLVDAVHHTGRRFMLRFFYSPLSLSYSNSQA